MEDASDISVKSAQSALNVIERIRELIFNTANIEQNLFSLHYIADLLANKNDIDWVEKEINDYSFGDELPRYRKNVYGFFKGRDIVLPESLLNTHNYDIRTNVPFLVSVLKNPDKDSFVMSISNKKNLDAINATHNLSLQPYQLTYTIYKAILSEIINQINLELIKRFEKLESKARSIVESSNVSNLNDPVFDYDSKKIFIVHGRDEIAKNELYQILKDKLNLEPIILMDAANEGKTLVEKFESHSLKVGYAFVLLTPDDVHCLKTDFEKHGSKHDEAIKELQLSSRQNVILELGYFVGRLGRKRVCCIQKGNIDLLPSDLHGLVTIRYSDSVKHVYWDIETELEKAGYLHQNDDNL